MKNKHLQLIKYLWDKGLQKRACEQAQVLAWLTNGKVKPILKKCGIPEQEFLRYALVFKTNDFFIDMSEFINKSNITK